MKRWWVLVAVLSAAMINVAQGSGTADLAGAGTVRFEVSKRDPLIGEPVSAALVAELAPGISLVRWPSLPPVWEDFTLSDMSEVQTEIRADGTGLYRQTMTLRVWRTGQVALPELIVQFQIAGDTRIAELQASGILFDVPSVLVADDLTLRPLKPQFSFFYIPMGVFLALGGMVYVLAYGARRRWQARGLRRQMRVGTGAVSVFARLAVLGQGEFTPAEIYEGVSLVLRGYLDLRFQIPALGMTTIEVIRRLEADEVARQEVPDSRRAELWRMLEQADLVKFAHMEPPTASASRLLTTAERWLTAAEQGLKARRESQEFAP